MKGAHVACEVHANRMCRIWASLTSWKFVAVPAAERGVQEQKALSPPVVKPGADNHRGHRNNSLLFEVSHLFSSLV